MVFELIIFPATVDIPYLPTEIVLNIIDQAINPPFIGLQNDQQVRDGLVKEYIKQVTAVTAVSRSCYARVYVGLRKLHRDLAREEQRLVSMGMNVGVFNLKSHLDGLFAKTGLSGTRPLTSQDEELLQ